MLSDRIFRYGWEAVAASFRMVKVVADVKPAEGARRWDEIVWWHGTPGQRSIWGIAPTTSQRLLGGDLEAGNPLRPTRTAISPGSIATETSLSTARSESPSR